MNEKKERRVSVRMTEEQYKAIEAKAKTAGMSVATYIRAASLRHRVTVIDGLKEFTHELKGIGRNLNQLAILAHEGKIDTVNLDQTDCELYKIYTLLSELVGKEAR